MKEAVFMLGLPGAGKTSAMYNFISGRNFRIVSADKIREQHVAYDSKHPDLIHEECVKLAEQEMIKFIDKDQELILMDGGGINNSYTERIINYAKSHGYKITVLFVNTPAHICVKRNLERMAREERFVPIDAILDKAYMLRKCEANLRSIADEFIEIKHFRDDVIFVDMDGTVAEYYKLVKDLDGNIDFVNYDIFKYSKPVMPVIDKLKELSILGKKICILSASPNSLCNIAKKEWIKKHLPFIQEEDIYFCGNKNYKYVMLQHLIKKLNLNSNQVMVIDDDHNVLETYEPLNVNAIHPSYFLTNY